jgi:hypothetical protein
MNVEMNLAETELHRALGLSDDECGILQDSLDARIENGATIRDLLVWAIELPDDQAAFALIRIGYHIGKNEQAPEFTPSYGLAP